MLRSQIVTDVVVAAALGVLVALVGSAGLLTSDQAFIVVGMTAALAVRRLSPGLALSLAWITAIAQMVTGQQPDPSNILIAGVMYTTSAYGSRRVRLAGLVSAIVGAVTAALYVGIPDFITRSNEATQYGPVVESGKVVGAVLIVVLALLLLPWLGGVVARTQQTARMSREAQLLAERDAARADRAVAVEQERVSIARDMHDIVAHSLAVVIAQADGARYALKADPAVADQALGTISSTARRALGDVRELLGALRHEQGTTPTPDVDDIERLVGEMREVGLEVEIERNGDPSTLPTSTQLAVYRIVQESLTNAYKHGERGTPVPGPGRPSSERRFTTSISTVSGRYVSDACTGVPRSPCL
jgi:signal transduction histidine kinase